MLTSNQLYRGINKRFDRRLKRLLKAGFSYEQGADGFAVICRTVYGRRRAIPAAALLYATNRFYWDILRGILR